MCFLCGKPALLLNQGRATCDSCWMGAWNVPVESPPRLCLCGRQGIRRHFFRTQCDGCYLRVDPEPNVGVCAWCDWERMPLGPQGVCVDVDACTKRRPPFGDLEGETVPGPLVATQKPPWPRTIELAQVGDRWVVHVKGLADSSL